jgi:dTDP-4-dehydrorhamnose 3,5-epimerase-like enzyme
VRIERLALDGLLLLTPKKHRHQRGFFLKHFRRTCSWRR